jgi:hypothetical protein
VGLVNAAHDDRNADGREVTAMSRVGLVTMVSMLLEVFSSRLGGSGGVDIGSAPGRYPI